MFICWMQQCVQQHEPFVPFLKITKQMMVSLYLKFFDHWCRKVCLVDCDGNDGDFFFLLEYSEKIPFVKEAPVEQESKAAASAKKK